MLSSIERNSTGQAFIQQVRAIRIPIIPPELVLPAINDPATFAKFKMTFHNRAGIRIISDHLHFGNQTIDLQALHTIALRAGGPNTVRNLLSSPVEFSALFHAFMFLLSSYIPDETIKFLGDLRRKVCFAQTPVGTVFE